MWGLINTDDTVKFPSVSNSEKHEDEGRSAVLVTGKEMETAGSQGKSLRLEQCLFCADCFHGLMPHGCQSSRG